MLRRKPPIGVVLAGGKGQRMGGSKLVVKLRGRPLLDYPIQAMKAVLPEVAVIAKPDVELPELHGVMVWIEAETPRHPLLGLVEALALADGRPVLVCPADLPFVTPALIKRLAEARSDGAPAVIASHGGVTQPLLGCYQPEAIRLLADAAYDGTARVRDVVAGIGPRLIEVGDPDELFNVNSPEDLLVAMGMLDRASTRSPTGPNRR
jgi:molybdopterin-guanine dinucleotide biosynthesis protein A